MPFKSMKQQKFMWSQKPMLAKEWTDKYGSYKGEKEVKNPGPKKDSPWFKMKAGGK